MTVICIAGMHRSGTSMISRLVNLCGVYLGRAEELMPANAYNVDGYWENLQFVEINNDILSGLNARWDIPPEPSIDLQSVSTALKEQAQTLLESFDGQTFWGWKDPRTSLTMPFWNGLIPDLKVIICLRNPLEVANSLTHRDNFSKSFGLDLWQTYNERLLSTVALENRIITHYSTYFSNPTAELQRLLDFIGIQADENTIQNSCKTTLLALRHNRASFEKLMTEAGSLEIINLYSEMCSHAGPVYWDSLADHGMEDTSTSQPSYEHRLLAGVIEKDPVIQSLAAHFSEKEKCIQSLQSQVTEKAGQISSLNQVLLEKEVQTSNLEGQIARLEEQIARLKEQIASLNQDLLEKEGQITDWSGVIDERERQLAALSARLTDIYSSRAWQLVQFLRRLRNKVAGQ
jgi:hypothetical protein